MAVNTLRLRQNGHHFTEGIFKWIFWNENVWILIIISLKFVPEGPIDYIPALFQTMTGRRPGNKPLSEPMMVSFPMHICITRPQLTVGMFAWISNYIPNQICDIITYQCPNLRQNYDFIKRYPVALKNYDQIDGLGLKSVWVYDHSVFSHIKTFTICRILRTDSVCAELF